MAWSGPQAMQASPRHNRLKQDVIEAVECMKSWQADGGQVGNQDFEQVRIMLEQLEAKGTGLESPTVD